MKKVIEGRFAVEELRKTLSESIESKKEWKNLNWRHDYHKISLIETQSKHFIEVDFGLLSTIWSITSTGAEQIKSKDGVEERAKFVEQMANEPILDR